VFQVKFAGKNLSVRINIFMKKINRSRLLGSFLIVLLSISAVFAQKRTAAKAKSKPIIFAVLNDGKTLEPIAFIEKGKLTATPGGDSEEKILTDFAGTFYKPKSTYHLIFGGADAGDVSVKSAAPKSDCGKNLAEASAQSEKAKLKGFVMALATDAAIKKGGTSVRRLPAPTERAEIEALVRAEFSRQKVAADALKNLRYHNLTALDVDNDGKAEMVGSFWVETAPSERALLFLIADKTKSGKYAFGYSEFKALKKDEVMNGEISSVDEGIYNQLLLDVFDYDGDGVSEIFSFSQSFEGSGFNVYRRENGKWIKSFEGSNYHCAY
jgi:hypothetical protein